MPETPTFQQIAQNLRKDPEAFATMLIGSKPTYKTGNQVRYYDNQSLVVFTSGPYQGRYKLFTDDEMKGDMIDLCKEITGKSAHDAIEMAKSFLGIDASTPLPPIQPPDPVKQQKELEENTKLRLRIARWIWKSSSATEGREEGLLYLKNRGIDCLLPSSVLRFRKIDKQTLQEKMGIPKKDIPDTPVVALVFCARNDKGEVTATQQILTTNGRKLKTKNPKITNGIITGSCVWLGDPSKSNKAVLVEGPETGCSIFQATNIPTAITLGTSNYPHVVLPKTITQLIIASDMERTGVGLGIALKAVQERNQNPNLSAGLALPKLNTGDFNDVLQNPDLGSSSILNSFENAFFAPINPDPTTILITPDTRAAFYVWYKSGLEVYSKPPTKNPKTNIYSPINADNIVQDHHKRVLTINTKTIKINIDDLVKRRKDIEIVALHDDSKEFRKLARTEGFVESTINQTYLYAPKGIGNNDPVFWTLTKKDADALDHETIKSIAIPVKRISSTNFCFMKNRVAIIAPIGTGTKYDLLLQQKLEKYASRVIMLKWQLFPGYTLISDPIYPSLPDQYSAKDAKVDGWTGAALERLIAIALATASSISVENTTHQNEKSLLIDA